MWNLSSLSLFICWLMETIIISFAWLKDSDSIFPHNLVVFAAFWSTASPLHTHTFLFHINKTVSRTQQLALADWRDEQKDCVFMGLQNKLRRTIYAEFCKFSEAENRLGSREEMMCQSKLSIQTQTSTTEEQSCAFLAFVTSRVTS